MNYNYIAMWISVVTVISIGILVSGSPWCLWALIIPAFIDIISYDEL